MKTRNLLLSFGALLAGALLLTDTAPVQAGGCYIDPVYARTWIGKINTGARVRDGACMEATNVLTTLPVGTSVNIIAETDGWFKVQLPDGTKGWVGATLITVTSREGSSNVKSEEKAYADQTYTETKTETKTEIKTETKSESVKDALDQRLKGFILLDVENYGEAWYVHPDEGKRFYMKDGKTAYEMMRRFGLGISNKDFNKLKNGDKEIKSRVKGKILLLVEMNGEAYYVHPEKGTLHYLKNGEEAYRLMREMSLGISKKDITQIKTRDFDEYVREKEMARETKSVPAVSGSIALTATVADGKVYLAWNAEEVDASLGFKVVWSQTENPVYPGNDYHYLSDPSVREDKIRDLDGGVYYIRVCQYLGGKCGVYSNNVKVDIDSAVADEIVDEDTADDSSSASLEVDVAELNTYWLGKINALRADRGLRLLVADERWMDTAMEWAGYMGQNNHASHDRPDGKSMHQWIDGKGLPFTVRNSEGGWTSNYFTENISWGYANGSEEEIKRVMDDTLAFYLSEAASNGPHYRTIYHPDWNSLGIGLYLRPTDNGFKVFFAFHYGSLTQ